MIATRSHSRSAWAMTWVEKMMVVPVAAYATQFRFGLVIGFVMLMVFGTSSGINRELTAAGRTALVFDLGGFPYPLIFGTGSLALLATLLAVMLANLRERAHFGPAEALEQRHAPELVGALLTHHRTRAPAATITVAPLTSPFGIVDVDEQDVVRGFREAPRLPHWVNMGLYVLDEEAIERLPERGDHEQTTFPGLAAAGRLLAFRHEGLWLTVNTPKDLRRAEEHFAAQM